MRQNDGLISEADGSGPQFLLQRYTEGRNGLPQRAVNCPHQFCITILFVLAVTSKRSHFSDASIVQSALPCQANVCLNSLCNSLHYCGRDGPPTPQGQQQANESTDLLRRCSSFCSIGSMCNSLTAPSMSVGLKPCRCPRPFRHEAKVPPRLCRKQLRKAHGLNTRLHVSLSSWPRLQDATVATVSLKSC
jgi:hypothetical protein